MVVDTFSVEKSANTLTNLVIEFNGDFDSISLKDN